MTDQILIVDIKQDNPSKSFSSMAEIIARMMESGQRCTPADLVRRNFRPMEVLKQWGAVNPTAKSIVQQRKEIAESPNA